MDQNFWQRIHEAAIDAWNDVWVAANDLNGQSGELPTSFFVGVVEHADAMYRQTVRDKCAEAGVEERDYWLARPEETMFYRPACMADQFDQIAADLRAESRRREREFWRTNPPF